MKSPLSMTIDSAAEPKTTRAAGVAAAGDDGSNKNKRNERLEQNRIIARDGERERRKRKKSMIEELQRTVMGLKSEYKELNGRNQSLRFKLAEIGQKYPQVISIQSIMNSVPTPTTTEQQQQQQQLMDMAIAATQQTQLVTPATKKRKQTDPTTPPKKKPATGIIMTNAENSIATEQKKETHAERQSRKTLLKTIDNYISAQLAPYPPVDLTLLKVAEQDAKNSKQRERYWNDPQVVAKQAERERIAKKKQVERDRKQETKKSSQTIYTNNDRLGAEGLNNALTNMEKATHTQLPIAGHRSGAVVTPPRPSSSASGGDNTQVDGEPPVASSTLIDIINIETGNIDDCDVVNKLVDIFFRLEEQDIDDSEEQVVGDDDQFSLFDLSIEHDTVIENDIDDDGAPPPTPHVVSAQFDCEPPVASLPPSALPPSQVASSPPSASPPQVFDILNIGTDHFSIIRLSLFNEMTAKELQKFCLKTVGLCDYFAKNDGKMYFALKQEGAFLQRIENNKIVFKSLIDECCKPLSELVFILEPHLLNLFPLLLLGELHMHSDRKIRYPVDGVIERWCFNITDKNMQLQQQGNGKDHVVFPCDHGNLVCMSDTVRGIVDIADGVRLQHGCPKLVMEAVGSKASITIVMDLCFGSKAVKNTVLEQVLSRFTSAVPSDSNSNSIQSLREVATTAVATRSPILLQDIDPNGIVKDAIDEKKALLLSICARSECNEKTDEGTRYCTTCVQGNKECCVKDCMDNRHSHERDCRYCLYHRDPKTRCAKCKRRGLADGSTLCSFCLVEPEAIAAKEKRLAAEAIGRVGERGFSKDDQRRWQRRYHELIEYKKLYHHTYVPQRYTKNPQLGRWVNDQRHHGTLLSNGKKSNMTMERIQLLNKIGFHWSYKSYWQRTEETERISINERKKRIE